MVRARSFFVVLLKLSLVLGGAVLICTLISAGIGYAFGAPMGGAMVGAALGILAGVRMYFSPTYYHGGSGRRAIVRDPRETGHVGGAGAASVGSFDGGPGCDGGGGSC